MRRAVECFFFFCLFFLAKQGKVSMPTNKVDLLRYNVFAVAVEQKLPIN